MSHFRDDKTEAQVTDVACSRPHRLWSLCALGSLFCSGMLYSLSALPTETTSVSSGKSCDVLVISVSPQMHPLLFLALLCVQEAGTTSFAPSIQSVPEEVWGIYPPFAFRSGHGFPSGCAPQEWLWPWSSSLVPMAAALARFLLHCSLLSALSLGVAKFPPVAAPGDPWLCSFIPSTLLYKVFSVNPLQGAGGSCQARGYA